jgi:hypothetical protein
MTLTGWPVTTISRGEIVCSQSRLVASPGRGSFLRCDTPAPMQFAPTVGDARDAVRPAQ